MILFKIIIYTRIISAEVGWESEKKKATKIIFGSRLNIKKKDGKGKRVTTAIMLYENEKLDEDVLETFHQSEVKTFVNLIFVWTIFGQNFVVDEQPTSFQPWVKSRY
mgnify:CR=1 FL=1